MGTVMDKKKQLTISLVQTEIHWEDKRTNLQNLEGLILSASKSDVILLPETFSTGFTMSNKEFAESWEGSFTRHWMYEMARRCQADIAGSFLVEENEKYYNRFTWVTPDRQDWHYNKRHLFTLAGEDRHYTQGAERVIIDRYGWKIMPQVCYDVRFPVWSRNDGTVDLMVYVANFPDKRKEAWTTLLKARAIENQCYVVGVNVVGEAGGIKYSGGSYIFDFTGKAILDCGEGQKVASADIDLESLQEFRKKFAFLQDRDEFDLKV